MRILSMILTGLITISVHAIPAFAGEDCDKAARFMEDARKVLDADTATAEQKLRDAVAICGKSASLRYNLGVALFQRDKNREAGEAFEEALRINPHYAKAMNSLASLVYSRKNADFTRALKLALRAQELEPGNRQYRDTVEMISAYVDFPVTTAINNPNAIAVIIGNKTYRDPAIPTVEYADNDAITVKKYLIESLGFREDRIIFRQNASFTEFLKIFGDSEDHKGILYNRTPPGADVFIFYSGHGTPDTNTRKAYLVPADLDPYSVKHTSYSVDVLYANLAKLGEAKSPRSMTVVLDACFSGASQGGMVVKNASPITLEVTAPLPKVKDAVVFTSSQGNQISSWYPEQKHSLFTYVFLRSVRDILASGQPLSSGEIETRLMGPDGVNQYALKLYNREQVPQVYGSKELVLTR